MKTQETESKMKVIDIKGKPYVQVSERVKEFWRLHGETGFITTEIVSNDEKRVIVKATVHLGDERILTGYSQAEWGKGMMGCVALEVAETSAVGRALGFANIGLLDGIATADEVRKNSKPPIGDINSMDGFEAL